MTTPDINKYLQIAAATGKVNTVVKDYYSRMVSLTVALGADKETAVKDMQDCLEFELKLIKVS